MSLRILSVFGTRPEAIKMAPVVRTLAEDARFDSRVCVTAQHRALLDEPLTLFGIAADRDLDLMRADQSPSAIAGAILTRLPAILAAERPDLVLVHGDTITSTTAAWAASLSGCRVGHVEAGLRSRDRRQPWPEEINRRLTGVLAEFHFAPTEGARDNLLAEGVDPDTIVVTGNSVIDALLQIRAAGCAEPVATGDRRLILVTGHRRENRAAMGEICAALIALAGRGDVDIVYPVHPAPAVRQAVAVLEGRPGIRLLDPLGYAAFVDLLARAHLVLTDSGGIQEEAPAFGVPVLVMRDVTERPEAVRAGTAKLVGTRAEAIMSAASMLLDNPAAHAAMARAHSPFGDGKAALRIRDAIGRWLS